MIKKLVLGILAHVDAGKTTLSESLLYLCGKIAKVGRVDNQDAYLDTFALEKARGITIFSKQALLEAGDLQITLLDTPGHVDFSAEMERTLQVLDYAVLVISGADGVQGHTKTLWQLLTMYHIPVFVFVNKMDQLAADQERLIAALRQELSGGCTVFGQAHDDAFYEQLAMCDEALMDVYLQTGRIDTTHMQAAIKERNVFPCYFGSALKQQGVDLLLEGIVKYAMIPQYPAEFGAKIFKITRDEQSNRLTHMKLTGGSLKVKDLLTSGAWEEKVNQIRLYSGKKYEAVSEVSAGSVFAVTGLNLSRPGEVLGAQIASFAPVLAPVLSYRILLPDGQDPKLLLAKLRQLEEEEPALHIVWNEPLQEIQAQLMGEVQIEILQSLIKNRFDVDVAFDDGKIVYKETIAAVAEGVGHFEPLRHYAEVHLLLEPGERGSGLQFDLNCSEDMLGKSWQRLVLCHLEEKAHRGVLTGALLTDTKITLVAGRAHNKHTEGGDFREATYRAVRQGLMEAEPVLLEPYYAYSLELPGQAVGRAMTDIKKMCGTCEISLTNGELTTLTGVAPVSTMRNYQKEVTAYTKGTGRLFCSLHGYEVCHNAKEVIESSGYDPQIDAENPCFSVFCANGAGFLVNWDEVKSHMHIESYLKKEEKNPEEKTPGAPSYAGEQWISPEEIDRIISRTFFANSGKKSAWKRAKPTRLTEYAPVFHAQTQKETKADYLLVDGYNIIFAWPQLKALADENMDAARMKLIDILSNYQGIRRCETIVVFDAYRVQGHREETSDFDNVHLVFTKEAQTADEYIEKFAYDNHKKYTITVATSDGLQQMIIRGVGCLLLSARELKLEIATAVERVMTEYQSTQPKNGTSLADFLSQETKDQLNALANKERE